MPTDDPPTLVIRDALPSDAPTIVDFNLALARETEARELDPSILRLGVERAIDQPDRLRYWVAERSGRIVGQAAVTREWSDWRCGWIWWFQSVYVSPQARRLGVFRALHRHIRQVAQSSAEVIGLRLYVERENHRARQTYEALGMSDSGYHVFEEFWPNRTDDRPPGW